MYDTSATHHFSLADLLRVRRKLAVREVIYLLDGAARSAFGPGDQISLRSLHVEISSAEREEKWISDEVTDWPVFHIRIVRAEVDETDLEKTRLPQAGATGRDTMLPQFAGVIYELLGGRNAAFEALRSPLPSLNEEANRILMEAMRTRSSDIPSFWDAWTRASGASAPHEVWRIPEWASREGGEHELIDLLPESERSSPIRLSARTQFRVGRSCSLSDFAVHGEEGDVAGAEIVSRISRVHLLGELSEEGIAFRDGDGIKPTLNGSTFDGAPLSSSTPRLITAGGLLKLAGTYELELLLARTPAIAREWQIENAGRMWPGGEASTFSSLRFRAARGGYARDAIWLFTMIGFTLRSSGKLEWHSHASDGFFIRSGGRFYVANAKLDASQIRIGDEGIDRQQLVPIIPGQSLILGRNRFTVATENSEESA